MTHDKKTKIFRTSKHKNYIMNYKVNSLIIVLMLAFGISTQAGTEKLEFITTSQRVYEHVDSSFSRIITRAHFPVKPAIATASICVGIYWLNKITDRNKKIQSEQDIAPIHTLNTIVALGTISFGAYLLHQTLRSPASN